MGVGMGMGKGRGGGQGNRAGVRIGGYHVLAETFLADELFNCNTIWAIITVLVRYIGHGAVHRGSVPDFSQE